MTDHGALLSEDKSQLDCKASRPLLVDHSISQKKEEEMMKVTQIVVFL